MHSRSYEENPKPKNSFPCIFKKRRGLFLKIQNARSSFEGYVTTEALMLSIAKIHPRRLEFHFYIFLPPPFLVPPTLKPLLASRQQKLSSALCYLFHFFQATGAVDASDKGGEMRKEEEEEDLMSKWESGDNGVRKDHKRRKEKFHLFFKNIFICGAADRSRHGKCCSSCCCGDTFHFY